MLTIDILFCMYVKGQTYVTASDLKERFLSFFICSIFFAIRISRFLSFFITRNKYASAIRRYPIRVLQTPNKQRTDNFWRVSDLQFDGKNR